MQQSLNATPRKMPTLELAGSQRWRVRLLSEPKNASTGIEQMR
jgi:hypothetical protein